MATAKPSEESEVVKFENFAVAKMNIADLTEIIEANTDGGIGEFDLDRIKIPSGGSLTWTVPTLDGEEDRKELVGVVVHSNASRAFWFESFDNSGGGSPPDCYSQDGTIGEGAFGPGSELNPTGACEVCPMSQWGSADPNDPAKKGQACKALRVLFLMTEDSLLPMVVVLPPTSLQAYRKFALRLAGRATPYWGVVIKITLERKKSGGGINYASAVFEAVERLDVEQASQMREIGLQLAGTFSKPIDALISAEDLAGAEA